MAEILLPVLFMVLLIMIKSLTSIYDSPNIAYYCGNAYPWFYYSNPVGASADLSPVGEGISPLQCLRKPDNCELRNYYKDSATFTYNDQAVTLSSQYGYVLSGASSGQSENPFYAYTIADPSNFYNTEVANSTMDNPSLPLCAVLYRLLTARAPSILVVAPQVPDDADLTMRSKQLEQFILLQCAAQTPDVDFSQTVRLFESQNALEDYCTDRHYDDEGYQFGKVAFGIVLNAADPVNGQWDYSIRANYTSLFDQDDKTVACLYRGCDFTYTAPSTKFSTQDLFKPQSAEFLYGYTYSGFSTLQQTVDQFIFSFHVALKRDQGLRKLGQGQQGLGLGAAGDTAVGTVAAAGGGGRHLLSSAQETTEQPSSSIELVDRSSSVSSVSVSKGEGEGGLGAVLVPIMASVGLMPTASYETDDFQYVISSTLGIFYMLSFLYPVSRIIRALVLEKETRIKEGECECVSARKQLI